MHRHAVATAHALFALLLGGANALAQPPQYTVQDLGTSSSSLPITVTGINRNGVVVGSTSANGGPPALAFRTQPNAPINLPADYIGTLGGSGTCGTDPCSSWAIGVNASGQVVGYSTTSSAEIHGFRTAANASINPATDDLGSLGGQPGPFNVLTEAMGINDSGNVVGFSYTSDGSPQAFRTGRNTAINPATDNIEPPPTNGTVYNSKGRSINSSGVTLGDYFTSAFVYSQLFLNSASGFQSGPVIDAETGDTNINDSDQVINSEANELSLWHNGALVPLATCPNVRDCFVRSLNNSFQAVGVLYQTKRAFLFMGGAVYDLNTLIPANSGWLLTDAVAINDNGQIIGTGTLNGVTHVVRLDPSKPPFTYSMGAASLISVSQGGSTTDNITLTLTSGAPGPVSFSTSPLPPGVTVTFSPAICAPTCTSTMTVSASADTYTGRLDFVVYANSPGFSASMFMTGTITTPSGGSGFSWSLSAQTDILSVSQGNSVSDLLTATLKSGTPDVITFRTTGSLPPGVNVTFSPASCTPNCTTTMSISTSFPTTPPGTYFINISGTCGCSAAGAVVQLQVTAGGDTTTGLVGWWKLNDGSGNTAADSSGSGNNATLYNPSWWTGNYGVTNLFNGSTSYGFVRESSSLEMTNQLTVAFWVRPTNSSSGDQRILNKIYDWDVKLTPQNDPQFDANGHYFQLNYALPANTWNHVAFTFNNGTVTGYVNGQAQSTVANTFTGSGSLLTWAYGLYLAAYDSTPSNAFAGSLNDVRVYNRALTAADVAAVFDYLAVSSGFSFSLAADLNPAPVRQGSSVTVPINATLYKGTPAAVLFTASSLPPGVTAQFSPTACTPTCKTLMTINASSTTPINNYNVEVTATGGGASANATVVLSVQAPASYSMSVASSNLSVAAGGSVSDTVTVTAVSGTQGPVGFNTSGLPPGATAAFSVSSCTPTCATTLTIATASTTAVGTYNVGITAIGGGSQAATNVTLTVNSGGGGTSPISLVQSGAQEGSGLSSISAPFASANTKGNLIIAFVRMSTTTQTVSVSDTSGNTYADAVSQAQSADGHQVHIFYATNIAGGPNTVTAAFSGTNNHPFLAIYEYNGPVTLDLTAAAQGYGSAPSSGATPGTRSTNELLFGAVGLPASYTGTASAGSGFTLERQDVGTSRAANEDQVVAATGSYTAIFNLSSSANWTAVLATFSAPRNGPVITTTSLPDGTQNTAYTATLTATGGTPPYTWSITRGALPAGLTLAPSTGAISGTPTTAGTSSFDVLVTDSNGMTPEGAVTLSIKINAASAPIITTTSLPNGTQNTAYSATLAATGGSPPYTWSIVGGALPAGLTLSSSTGTISGTPTGTGISRFNVFVTDSNSTPSPGSEGLSITINPSGGTGPIGLVQSNIQQATGASSLPAAFTSANTKGNLVIAVVKMATTTQTVTVSDTARNVYREAVSQSQSSDGHQLHLFYASNIAGGTNEVTATFSGPNDRAFLAIFEYRGVNALDRTAAAQGFGAAPSSGATQPTTSANELVFGAAGLPAAYNGTPTAGSGFTLEQIGVVGDPAAAAEDEEVSATGSYAATFNLSSSVNWTAVVATFGSGTASAPTITTTTLPTGTQDVAYNATLAAAGGITPYTWSLTTGTLPAGLSLNASTGTISGTPTTSGTSSFTVQVTDANSQTATRALSMTINPSGGSSGPIALVQSSAQEGSGVPSVSVPFTTANTKGNLIIAFVRMSNTTQTVSVSDTAGNVYTDAVSQVQPDDGHQVHIFYAPNIAGGANTVTAAFSGSNNHPWMAIYEYSGVSALDRTAGSFGWSALPNSGATGTTASPNELMFSGTGLPASYSGTAAAGNGFTLQQQDTGTSRAANESAVVTTTGNYGSTFSLSSIANWTEVIATFR